MLLSKFVVKIESGEKKEQKMTEFRAADTICKSLGCRPLAGFLVSEALEKRFLLKI